MTTTTETAGVKPAIISDEQLHARLAFELARLADRVKAPSFSMKVVLWMTEGKLDTEMQWGASVHFSGNGCEIANRATPTEVIEELVKKYPDRKSLAARKRAQAIQLLFEAQKLEEAKA